MIGSKVMHKAYGEGTVVSADEKYVTVVFDIGKKTFQTKSLCDFCIVKNENLMNLIKKAKMASSISMPVQIHTDIDKQEVRYHQRSNTTLNIRSRTWNSSNSLIGPHAQSIEFSSANQMFEVIGYMATPGRIGSIEAEVPRDGRDVEFERMFPGQRYRPIEMSYTPSGMPNKLSPQFRINFLDLSHCPQVLKQYMGVGNGSCVGRINKSRFVMELVLEYGFRFGFSQDVNKIRSIANEKGFLQEFEQGYSL